MSPEPEERVLRQTRRWVERVVIGLNLCPFAHKEAREDRIRYRLSASRDLRSSLVELAEELALLGDDDAIGTTLLVYPALYPRFDDYLELLSLGEELVELEGYRGVFQLASFHPEYCFEGARPEDPANLSNRSPYPMLHLLREDAITAALERYPDPAEIPRANQRRCRELGVAGVRALLDRD